MIAETLVDPGSGAGCEDALVASAPWFGVFDGATSLDRDRGGGARAASVARAVFSLGNDEQLETLLGRANERIGSEMTAAHVDRGSALTRWATTAAVVRVGRVEFEWIVIGDSVVMAISADGAFRVVSGYVDHDRETKLLRRRLGAVPYATARVALEPALRAVRNRANVDYGSLDGTPAALAFASTGRERLEPVRHLLVFTDGLVPPKRDPDAPEDWEGLVSAFLDGGLRSALALVRSRERSDPECFEYPRLKSHDDVAAVALSF